MNAHIAVRIGDIHSNMFSDITFKLDHPVIELIPFLFVHVCIITLASTKSRAFFLNVYGWIADGGKTNEYLYYGAYGRNAQTYAPSVDCANKNDAFTVEDTVNGNGALTYPVGLITADEMTLAGASWSGYYSNNYLNTGQGVWSGSPRCFNRSIAGEFFEISSGDLNYGYVIDSRGVRPLVSIAPETFIQSGECSQTDPWVR